MAQGACVETANADGAAFLGGDEAGEAEEADVFGDGGPAGTEVGGDVTDGLAAGAEQAEDLAAGGVGEGPEDGLGLSRRGNHLITHMVTGRLRKSNGGKFSLFSWLECVGISRTAPTPALPRSTRGGGQERKLLSNGSACAHIAWVMRDEVAMAEPSELLAEYASTGSEEAFRGVVEFYLGLVFSACCRQLRDRHLAEDATQAVFLLLSEKAGSVAGERLGGWLLTTSRFVCANIRKSRQRRQRREQVVAMNRDETSERSNSTDLLDFLDDALGRLGADDREALILSFLREQPIAEVAANLAVSEPAARKRVVRAMEKLRSYFRRRGITADSSLLAGVLGEQLRGSGLSLEARRAVMQGVIRVVARRFQAAGRELQSPKGPRR